MTCTEQSFLNDVKDHRMNVIRDDGVYRHLRFNRPGTGCMHFDLITWPGYLCYAGDMGTYVFTRLEDMFEFFRTDRESGYMRAYLEKKGLTLGVNFQYWGEKVEAGDRRSGGDGVREFSLERAIASVKEYVENRTADWHPGEQGTPGERGRAIKRVAALQAALKDEVYGASDEWEFIEAVRDFNHEGFAFDDFWEYETKAYTHRFLWCCYALAWGIQQYDNSRAAILPPPQPGITK